MDVSRYWWHEDDMMIYWWHDDILMTWWYIDDMMIYWWWVMMWWNRSLMSWVRPMSLDLTQVGLTDIEKRVVNVKVQVATKVKPGAWHWDLWITTWWVELSETFIYKLSMMNLHLPWTLVWTQTWVGRDTWMGFVHVDCVWNQRSHDEVRFVMRLTLRPKLILR